MKLWKILGIELYEVGDIFINMSGNNPGNRFKGTWELIAKGKTLVGVDEGQTEFNTPGKTGGAKTHTLTIDEMPKHSHNIAVADSTTDNGTTDYLTPTRVRKPTTGRDSFTLTFSGRNQSHNNLQPYITCYIWQRVS